MNKGKSLVKRFVTLSLAIITIYFVAIVYLVTLDVPAFTEQKQHEMTPQQIDDLGFEQKYQHAMIEFEVRDSSILRAQRFHRNSDLSIVVLHGILSNGAMNNRFSGLLSDAANAEVFSLDLRGHGVSDGNPGDVDYIGQYVDDIADVIKHIKSLKPNGKVILAGHSMGGGISLKFSMNKRVPDVDGFLLFAPQLGKDSPTNSFSDATHREQDQSFMVIHIQRLVGLIMLNSLGIDYWNDLPVFFFNLPVEVPLSEYTYRSSASMSPESYKDGLESVTQPLLVVVGEKDEAFNTHAYKKVIQDFSDGDFLLVDKQTHNGIRHDNLAMERVTKWLENNELLGE